LDPVKRLLALGSGLLLALVARPVTLAQTRAWDGHTDLYWQNRATGQVSLWYFQEDAFLDAADHVQTSGPTNQHAVATGDFNQDGHTDLLWQHSQTRDLSVWLMRGTNRLNIASLPPVEADYTVVGVGDFNADGWPDILWHHRTSGNGVAWFMEGSRFTGRVGWIQGVQDPQATAVAVGDFNLDNASDVLWRNIRTGQNYMGFMTGTNLLRQVEIQSQPDPRLTAAGCGPFNRLGNIDLIWRHETGTNLIWTMRGADFAGVVRLPAVADTNWSVVGTGGFGSPSRLSAIPTSQPPSLTLQGLEGMANRPMLLRHAAGDTTWKGFNPPAPARRWVDTNVAPGQFYEYRLGGEYLIGGVQSLPPAHRGRVLLLIDETLVRNKELAIEVSRFHTNLVGDGWTVERESAPRHNDRNWSANPPRILEVKQRIAAFHQQAPQATNLVFIIGHVVIPYAGETASDGHTGTLAGQPAEWNDHRGAWVADGFYGDLETALWTDSKVFQRNPLYPECANEPMDGKYDNDTFPSDVEVGVGRVDFARLPCFERPGPKLAARSEAELIMDYLRKNEHYRFKQLVFTNRLQVEGCFASDTLNASIYQAAIRNGTRWFGTDPALFLRGNPWITPTNCLWSFLSGHGVFQAIQGPGGILHLAADLARPEKQPPVGFYVLQGSWFADWNLRTNNLLRCLLAPPQSGLGVLGFSSALFSLHAEKLAMGDTLGRAWLRTVNLCRPRADRWLSLLGDPSLRLQVTTPPSGLMVRRDNGPRLSWDPSPESNAVYWVFRSRQGIDGPWDLLTPNPIAQTEFTDSSSPAGHLLYQVRALQLVTTGSGSFTNVSQGVFASTN
jgi:hypothetical protein